MLKAKDGGIHLVRNISDTIWLNYCTKWWKQKRLENRSA